MRFAVLAALALWGMTFRSSTSRPSTSAQQYLLALNIANNGQHVAATLGEQIEITLGTIGPRHYGAAEISSPAIRPGGVALKPPFTPGGPTFIYIFEAAAEGEARIRIPIVNGLADNPEITRMSDFAVTIRVLPSPGKSTAFEAFRKPDQANTAAWRGASTVLQHDYQTFMPSLPLLTAVEVELVVANPGPADDEVDLMLRGPSERSVLASVSKTVTAAECSHVLFIFPNGGVRVSPGEVYSLALGGSRRFGWKYVKGRYAKGEAFSGDGKPLLPQAQSAFLFRTFGAN